MISICIPSFNGKLHLQDCLPSVISAVSKAPMPVEIVVCDDRSTDDSIEFVQKNFPTVKIVPNPNKGICSARNCAVEHSHGDIIMFIDNDVFLHDDFFHKIEKYLTDEMDLLTCAGYYAYPKDANIPEQLDGIKLLRFSHGYFRFNTNIFNDELKGQPPFASFGVQGAYFLLKRKVFDKCHGFSRVLEPYMLDESDFMYRAMRCGFKITYAYDVMPRHKWGGTIASKVNPRSKFLSKRNRIIFVWKNVNDPWLLFQNIVRALFMSKSIKATWAAVKLLPQILAERKQNMKDFIVSDAELLSSSCKYEQARRLTK